ncbi:SRPBCC domain-containing protein [Pelagibius sp.]|uniref:SRPBCC family protein n=1 Tax=Pelagibius sp. TaxID=1931238 RepID=UPI002609EA1D|nr:SRPBCC domain-containing protein [Pelagibius sp.]
MTERESKEEAADLVLEYELEAPPEKVWRAISVPALRDRWLPDGDLAQVEPVSSEPGAEVRYRLRDEEPPFLESLVTFQVRPNGGGGTILRIVHGLVDECLQPRPPTAANSNRSCLMRAA